MKINCLEISKVLLISFATFFYIDFFSKTTAGFYLSFSILLILFFLLIYNYSLGVFSFLFVSIVTPQFSRSLIYEVVESNNENVDGFFSFHSTSIFGFSLPIVFILLAAIFSFFRLLKSSTKFQISLKEPLFMYLSMFLIIFTSTAINVLDGRDNDIREMISDSRPIIIWVCGAMIYHSLRLELSVRDIIDKFYKVLIYSVGVIGVRVVIFAFSDSINGISSFDFSTQPYIAYPFLFALIYCYPKSLYKPIFIVLAFFAAFSLKRSDIAFVVFLLFIYFSIGYFSSSQYYKKMSLNSLGYVFSLVFLILFLLFNFSESTFDFFVYKINFFTTEIWDGKLSNSALVRRLEFENIIFNSLERVYPTFIGSGLGGYFNFSYTSIPISFGVSDFSFEEISSNKFVKPHTFINFIFLKGGLMYLCFYIFMVLSLLMTSFRCIKALVCKNNKLRVSHIDFFVLFFFVGYSIFCLNMFWQPVHCFLFVLSLCLVKDFYQEVNDEVYSR